VTVIGFISAREKNSINKQRRTKRYDEQRENRVSGVIEPDDGGARERDRFTFVSRDTRIPNKRVLTVRARVERL